MTTPDLVVGLDLGGTKLLGVVLDAADPSSDPIAELRVPTPREGADALLAALGEMVAELTGQARSKANATPRAVGLGAPGLVDRAGVLRFGANLPSAIGFDFETGLRDVTGLAVAVDNDATCAAWGEHRRGASADARSSLMVTLGTGIGAGIATDDVLFRGAYGFAGEPGHMMVDPNGPPCPCGLRGCWERYGSGSGLARLAREAAIAGQVPEVVARAGGDPQDVRGEHVTAAAADGDDSAIEVIAQFGWWVAVGIANLVNVLDVETVVVGGGLVAAGDLILDPVRTAYPDLVYGGRRRPDVPIKPAVLGERAGAIGAALLAADRAREKAGVEAPSE